MIMRKLRFTAIILALALFTGCTQDGIAYLEMTKNAALMDGASITGNYQMKLDIAEPVHSMAMYGSNMIIGSNSIDVNFYEWFTDLSVDYNIEYVKSKGIAQGTFTDSKTGDTMLTFVLKDKKLYADISYALKLTDEFLVSDYGDAYTVSDAIKKEAIEKNISDIKYISIDMDDIAKLYGDEYDSNRQVIEDILSLNIFKQTGEAQAAFIDNILLGAFEDFEEDIVTYNDGVYSIKLDTKKSLALLESTLVYLIDNAEKTAAAVEKVINVYPSYYEPEYNELIKEEMRTGINELVDTVSENRVLYKDMVKAYLNSENVSIAAILAYLNGSSFESVVEDKNGSLSRLENMTVNVKAGMFTPETSAIEISNKHSIKAITDIEIALPDSNETKSITALKDTIKYPRAMVIWYPYYYEPQPYIDATTGQPLEWSEDYSETTDNLQPPATAEFLDVYSFEPFSMDYVNTSCITTDEELYLETSQVAEFFEDNFNNYTVNNNQADIKFITIEDTQYINIYDLAEIGYEVNYDDYNDATIIIKR